MATARDITAGGFSPGQAKAIQGQVKTAITAAGTTQGTATSLTASINLVSTATSLQGVILPSVEIGDSLEVYNDATGTTIVVYPPTSGTINQLSANSGVNLANNTYMVFRKVTATRWIALLSA